MNVRHVLQAAFATVAADCVRISRLGGEIRTTAGYSQR